MVLRKYFFKNNNARKGPYNNIDGTNQYESQRVNNNNKQLEGNAQTVFQQQRSNNQSSVFHQLSSQLSHSSQTTQPNSNCLKDKDIIFQRYNNNKENNVDKFSSQNDKQ
jgi:hypothetical protein